MSKKEKKKQDDAFDIMIETPKGCRNKYAWEPRKKGFVLKKILPAGAVFPFNFGFIPDTRGEDGDPLDVLVIMDEPAFPGCIVSCHIIGSLKARQSKKDKWVENDRLIAVSVISHTYNDLKDINDLNPNVKDEISHFFVSYNEQEGKKFIPEGWIGAEEARQVIEKAS